MDQPLHNVKSPIRLSFSEQAERRAFVKGFGEP
jgi:hypothetical protein